MTPSSRVLSALAFAAVLCSAAAHADGDETLYRDPTWRFQMTIAPGWTAQPLTEKDFPAVLIVRGPKALDRREVIDLHGNAARFIEVSVPSPPALMYLVLFQAPGRAFRGLCEARQEHYTRYRPVFERMLRSMTASD